MFWSFVMKKSNESQVALEQSLTSSCEQRRYLKRKWNKVPIESMDELGLNSAKSYMGAPKLENQQMVEDFEPPQFGTRTVVLLS